MCPELISSMDQRRFPRDPFEIQGPVQRRVAPLDEQEIFVPKVIHTSNKIREAMLFEASQRKIRELSRREHADARRDQHGVGGEFLLVCGQADAAIADVLYFSHLLI